MIEIGRLISAKTRDILKAVSTLAAEQASSAGRVFTGEDIARQAERTLEMLVPALRDGTKTPLFDYWEALGGIFAEQKFAMAEIPKTPELVKRSIWTVLERRVESGEFTVSELVDSMMDVESILVDCWFSMVRGYLGSRDIEVAARTQRMEALYSLAEVLSGEHEEAEVYKSIVDKVSSITGLLRCSLLLFDEDGKLEVVASNYIDAIDRLHQLSDLELSALSAVISLGGPVVLHKGSENPPEIENILTVYWSPTVLLVPLRSGEKDLGMLILDEGKEGEFSREQIELAVASANQAAIAVEKGGLLQEMESRLKHMAAISIVARTLTSYLDPREQLQGLLEMAIALTRGDRGLIMLRDETTGELELSESKGIENVEEQVKVVKLVMEWVTEHRETVILKRDVKDPRFHDLSVDTETGICAPLMIHENAIGAMLVASGTRREGYTADELEMFGNFAEQAAVAIENTRLNERLEDTYLGAIASLAAAIEARDPYTVGHSTRVMQYAVAIAEAMDLPADQVEELRLAGLLHDLGKIGVPDSILNKPDKLSEEEFSVIKTHPSLSMRIIEPLPHLGNIIPIIYHHHERYDGDGYTDGKADGQIPLGARIISVADAFEAMTSDRPYRPALSREEAVGELRKNSGTQFDPKVVSVFIGMLERFTP